MKLWKKQVEESFDAAADSYDKAAWLQRRVAEKLITFAPNDALDILEIGCGTGALSQLLADKYTNANITCSDISPSMLAAARSKVTRTDIDWKIIDGEAPTLDKRFDLIISNMAFQWFEDQENALETLRKSLKDGGKILFSQPGEQSFKEWRDVCAKLDIPVGVLDFATTAEILTHDILDIEYDSSLDMLKSIRQIGAHRPKSGYKSVGVKLRKACRVYDGAYQGWARWHILYAMVE